LAENTHWHKARVTNIQVIANDVRKLTFADDGFVMPFEAGSHTNVRVTINGAKAIRTYSCLPGDPGTLNIAVKLHDQSRGGSRFMWSLHEGDEVEISAPENRFELSWRASHYLLMAGGIGITPIYGMAKMLVERGAAVTMVYGAANRAAMPFADELVELLRENIDFYEAEKDQFIDLDAEIAALPQDGELYVCGPLGMLNAVKKAWEKSGRPVSRLRLEVFGDNGKFVESPFKVEVVGKGIAVEVPADRSLLDALRDAGVEMISECERGECGLCAVDVISSDSEIDHRDVFFSDEEKQENHKMCSCVSRLVGGTAVIDTGYRA